MTAPIGIGTSASSLAAQKSLSRTLGAFDRVNEQLATGIKINHGSDNPAGMIAMTQLQAELSAIEAATQNTSRASGVINVMDSALGQVGSLLSDINSSIVGAAGAFTDAEKESYAMQAQEAIAAINRIGASTQFGSIKLFDGSTDSLSFAISPDVSKTATISLPTINSANLGGAAGMVKDILEGGSANLTSGNLQQAQQIVSSALTQIGEVLATLGSFQKNTLETNEATLSDTQINLAKSASLIGDTDYAIATSEQTKMRILSESGISTLLVSNNRAGALRVFKWAIQY